MSLASQLREISKSNTEVPRWKGTFAEFLDLIETNQYPNIGVNAHRRIYDMIISGGTEETLYFGKKRIKYNFLENTLFGIERPLDKIMEFIHAAAFQDETSKRMLLLWGPPGTGKSELVTLLKRGLEEYSKTDAGAVFALSGCKMHENPLYLIPDKMREEFFNRYGIRITGHLNPYNAWRLEEEFKGDFMKYPVERIFIQESTRTCIGSYLPSDPKCVSTETTRVYIKDRGIVKVNELFNDNNNFDENGFSPLTCHVSSAGNDEKIKGLYNNGFMPVYRTNIGGIWFDCTLNHRVMTLDKSANFVWKKIEEIKNDDPIVIRSNLRKFGKDQTLSDFEGNTKKINPDIAEIIGGLVAESSCYQNILKYHNYNVVLLNRFDNLVKNEFLIELNRGTRKNNDSESDVMTRKDCCCTLPAKLSRWINFHFGLDCYACEKRIPSIILQSSEECQRRFLEGAFLGDGRIGYRKGKTPRFTYGTCSEELAMDIQSMLLNFGFITQINTHRNKKFPKNLQYTVSVEGNKVFEISDLFPVFSNNRQFKKTDNFGSSSMWEYFGSLSLLINEIKENSKSAWKIIDSRYTMETENKRTPKRKTIQSWINLLDTELEWSNLDKKREIIGKLKNLLNYNFARLNSKNFIGMKHCIDMSCDSDTFSYVTNGIISHNSSDQSELIGNIDYAKIQEYGIESHPAAFSFDGELNVANRGLMDFVEGLKSIVGDTYISTINGLKTIKDIHGPEKDEFIAHEQFFEVNSGDGCGRIIRSCYKGKAKCIDITTSKGYSFTGSIDHRIQCLSIDGKIEWKANKEIQIGDTVLISTFSDLWTNKECKLPVQQKSYSKRSKKIKIPTKMTKWLARFLGYYVAEGSFGDYCVCIANKEKYIIDDLEFISNKMGIHRQDDKKGHSSFSSVRLVDFLKMLGLTGNESDLKIIPQVILESPKNLVIEFLRAYFDGDGTVNDHRISCSTSSPLLAKQIQLILLNFGIISNRYSIWNEKYQKNYYVVQMDSVHRDNFVKIIGFGLKRKNTKAMLTTRDREQHRHTVSCSNLFNEILSEIKETSKIKCLAISHKKYTREKEEGALISRRVYNNLWRWSRSKGTSSVEEIRRISSSLPSSAQSKLSDILKQNVYFDTVKDISPERMEEIYDVHETTKHAYTANGFIHHNSDEKFLRVLLTATQEKKIKSPRFGLIDCDEFIILHTNETEFRSFMSESKYEAYHDRMAMTGITHILSVKDEIKLYDKLLKVNNANKDVHIAPHTLDAAAMFAVLSRIEEPEGKDLSLIKKMKLYNGEYVKGYKEEDAPLIKEKFPNEGYGGISPRFMIDILTTSITKAANNNQKYITGLDVLMQLNSSITSRDVFTSEEKTKYKELVDLSREEWDRKLLSDIQKAFFTSFEAEAKALCENYLDAIDAISSGKKPRDPITGHEKEIDEKLMKSIEDNIGVSSSGRDDFRNEILRMFASSARKGKKFNYIEHTQLREGIEKHMFSERKGYIRTTVATRNPEPEAKNRLNTVISTMIDQYGYTEDSAKEVLKYATAHLFDK